MKISLLISFSILLLFTFSSNAQTGWVQQTNPLGSGESAMVGKVQFVSPSEGWINTGSGSLLHTTNAGTDWTVVTPFPNDTVWSFVDPAINMDFINSTTGWMLKSLGTGDTNSYGAVVYKTTDGGGTWAKKIISNNQGEIGIQLQFVDADYGWISVVNFATMTGYIYKTTDGGNTWSLLLTMPPPLPDEMLSFYFVDHNEGWMVSINDNPPLFKISQSTDGGSSWNEQYSDNTTNGDTLSASGAMQFVDSNNGWVVGPNGRILKTTDGGSNWTLLTTANLGIYANSKCLYFLDANTGWIGTNIHTPNQPTTHLLINTTDGGSTWTQQPVPFTDNSVFSIYFVDAQNGWITADTGVIAHYSILESVEGENNIPIKFSLQQNYPNPFNPTTKIRFTLPEMTNVTLKVFNILGQEVATLVNGKELTQGLHEYSFDGSELSSGIYIYKIIAGNFIQSKKMTLMK